MKKVMAIVVAAVLCLSLMCACGGDDKGTTTATNAANADVTAVQGGVQTSATNAAVNNDANVGATNGQVSGNQPAADGLESVVAKYVDVAQYSVDAQEYGTYFTLNSGEYNTFNKTFQIAGKTLPYPCTYAEVADALDCYFDYYEDETDMVEICGDIITLASGVADNSYVGEFTFYNYTGSECMVSETELYKLEVSENLDSANICGVTGNSDIKSLISTMGAPVYIEASDDGVDTYVLFVFGNEEGDAVYVDINAENDSIESIRFEAAFDYNVNNY